MNMYDRLGWYYAEINRDSALFYFENELPIAKDLDLKLYEADALNGMGYALHQLGNYPKSLESYLESQRLARDVTSEKNVWSLTNNAWNTSKTADAKKARLDLLGWILHGIGELYGSTGNETTRIANVFESRNLAASVQDTTLLEVTNSALGYAYFAINKLDSALFYQREALSLYNRSDVFRKYEGSVLLSIGKIHQKKGDFALSKEAFMESAKVNEEQSNLSGLGDSYLALADLYVAAKNPDTGMFYARKALEMFKKVGLPSGHSVAYSLLSSIYGTQNKPDSALAYLRLASVIKDSLANAERTNLLAFKNRDFDEIMKVKELEEEKRQTQSRLRIAALLAGIVMFLLITLLLYRDNKQRQKANALLQKQNEEIEIQKRNVEGALAELKAMQAQLIQSEKMASLGELTAGIAHEIQNPLNFVNNFSEANSELLFELKQEVKAGNANEVLAIAEGLEQNQLKITHHGQRADSIVKGMLQHARVSTGKKQPTDINKLADEYLRLSYQGMRAKDNSFNASLETNYDNSLGEISIVTQDIARVLLNLYNNAFYAVAKKKDQLNGTYEPILSVSTRRENNNVQIVVKDNGTGMSAKTIEKVFQPFFTTKPTGEGTGLGLSLSYDIIKAHGGEIKVDAKEGKGSEFIIQLPV